jgi:hypothetical protein
MPATSLVVVLVVLTALSGNASAQLQAPVTFADFEFTPPHRWHVQRQADNIQLQNPESGCLILIAEAQQSSGNLEEDAMVMFDWMYKGWNPRKDGPQRYMVSKGVLPKGVPFAMVEAPMGKLSPDGATYAGFEDGVALVVGAGNRHALVAVRHKDLPGHVNCLRYDGWRRFFNSITLKNAPAVNAGDDGAARIVGRWTAVESGVVGDYIFSADGRYSYGGAGLGSDQAADVEGVGTYTVRGNKLTMVRRGAPAEAAAIRFVQVNQGGTGWNDRLCFVRTDPMGMENEACYRRQDP